MRIITLLLFVLNFSYANAQKEKPNIINYFASNNQIIGVPFVDYENTFRFYPDATFQKAIENVNVYYFVSNDVFKSHLLKREEGRYWECRLRDFELGESIQRVEVVVECNKNELIKLLAVRGLKFNDEDDYSLDHFLLLRRGDDRIIRQYVTINDLKNQLEENYSTIFRTAFADLDTTIDNWITNQQKKVNERQQEWIRKGILEQLSRNELLKVEDVLKFTKYLKDSISTKITDSDSFKIHKDTLINLIDSIQNLIIPYDTQAISKKLKKITFNSEEISLITPEIKLNELMAELPKLQFSYKEEDQHFPDVQNPELYFAYVENRRSSMLDMQYKDGDKKLVQFTYRNNKQSLQYLQADDPQEKLGIFRARLIPFSFYSQNRTDENVEEEFKWQRGKVIYEIGINFGYAIIKGDHFKPKFFDMNRLGIGIGITADTFSEEPSFLSVSLTYDINTYASFGFGAMLINEPQPYFSIGINARAFKDLVANSRKLFSGE